MRWSRKPKQDKALLLPTGRISQATRLVEGLGVGRWTGAGFNATAASPNGADGPVTGLTAAQLQFRDVLAAQLPVISAVVAAAAFLLLLAVFRGLLVAVKAARRGAVVRGGGPTPASAPEARAQLIVTQDQIDRSAVLRAGHVHLAQRARLPAAGSGTACQAGAFAGPRPDCAPPDGPPLPDRLCSDAQSRRGR